MRRLTSCGLVLARCGSALLAVVLVGLIAGSEGCSAADRTGAAAHSRDGWQPWQVLETQTGRVLPLSEWFKELHRFEIVYLGEEHYNKEHIEAALKILKQLMADGIQPTIGMEMFGWDGQDALDHYLVQGPPVLGEFLEQVRWKQNWGGTFEEYEPLVIFAREQHLSIRALNPPRPLIRRVVQLGLAQARQDADWKQWGLEQEEIIEDPAYRERILDQLRRCHSGGTDEDYRTMYEASMVRDEGMAKTLVAQVGELRRARSASRTMILSYTGGGHIQYNLPVPRRVARRLSGHVAQASVYLVSFDPTKTEDIQELLRTHIADYVWLTPMREPASSQRCR